MKVRRNEFLLTFLSASLIPFTVVPTLNLAPWPTSFLPLPLRSFSGCKSLTLQTGVWAQSVKGKYPRENVFHHGGEFTVTLSSSGFPGSMFTRRHFKATIVAQPCLINTPFVSPRLAHFDIFLYKNTAFKNIVFKVTNGLS